MPSERLFGYDPATRKYEWFSYDDSNDTFTIRTEQDIETILELNRESRNATGEGWKGEFHHVASIPNTVLAELKEKGILDDEKAFSKWLNDRDNLPFRTRMGRV